MIRQRLVRYQKKFPLLHISETNQALVVISAITVIWVYVFRDYLFFNKAFVFNKFAIDTISQFYPLEYFRLKNLCSGIFPFWSFQFDLGVNVYSMIANANPFDLFFLLFGPDHFLEAMPVVILLKFITTGIFFHAFLRKLNCHPYAALIGTILFVFSGYMVINTHWYHYANYTIFIAVFLYYFEVWFQHGRWFPLVILLGLVALKGELQLFQMVCFGSLYVLYRGVNVLGTFLEIVKVYSFLALIFITGIILGAYTYLPSMMSILSSSRVEGAVTTLSATEQFFKFFQLQSPEMVKIFVARLFSGDLLGSWIGYKGNSNYFEDSTLYVGLLPVCLLFLLFVIRNEKAKLLWVFPFTIVALCLFPHLRAALNGFASSTFKYLSLYCGFFLLFPAICTLNYVFSGSISTRTFSKINRVAVILLGGLAGAIALYYFFLFSYPEQMVLDKTVTLRVFLFLIGYLLLFLLIAPRRLGWIKKCLLCLVIFEAALFARETVVRNPGALIPFFTERGEYYFNLDTRKAIERIKKTDDSFYRIEKSYNDGHLNDSLVQQYFGTQSYFGFASKGVVEFYRQLKLSNNSPRLASYRYGMEKRGALQSLLGVKYYICSSVDECQDLQGFSFFSQQADLRIYKNDRVLPFGTVFYNQIKRSVFEQLSIAQKDNALLHGVVTENPLVAIPNFDLDQARTTNRLPPNRGDFLHMEDWGEEFFSGQVSIEKPGVLFFPIPDNPGWKIYINGIEEKLLTLDYGFCGVHLPTQGTYKVSLEYQQPLLRISLFVSLFTLVILLCLRRKYPVIKIS